MKLRFKVKEQSLPHLEQGLLIQKQKNWLLEIKFLSWIINTSPSKQLNPEEEADQPKASNIPTQKLASSLLDETQDQCVAKKR